MQNMNATPVASRFTIGLFGRRNVGKSSLINAITNQSIAVISPVAGTTTDPVYKTMEMLPIGPVVFIDTAGLDDFGDLGMLRVEKTYEVLRKCDFAIVVTDEKGITSFEEEFIDQLKRRKINFVVAFNKCDNLELDETKLLEDVFVRTSTVEKVGIEEIKAKIIEHSRERYLEPSLVEGLMGKGDIAILVTPIDSAAPKGRLILPQQQTIRDILDKGAMAFVTQDTELEKTLASLKYPPTIVITDSQRFEEVAKITPEDIPLTSFSMLFARQKGDISEMVRGVEQIEKLRAGDSVLIVEGCTHHKQEDDIGTKKIPRWINKMVGEGVKYEWASGAHYPKDIDKYKLIIHCGGCMLNHQEMGFRITMAKENQVFITNYGVVIAYLKGILPRALKPLI